MAGRQVEACIGLGGNLGQAATTVRAAFGALDALPGTVLRAASPLYLTPAWGVRAQPEFVNAAALVSTMLSPRDLLDALLEIERGFGRTREEDGSDRWGPRTLDLDLLLYADERVELPGLCVPHPRLHQRAFALIPLLDILPDAVIPGIGPARAALAALEPDTIRALD